MQVIVTIYVSLIVANRRTLDQVPANIREDVKADLEALGFTSNKHESFMPSGVVRGLPYRIQGEMSWRQ